MRSYLKLYPRSRAQWMAVSVGSALLLGLLISFLWLPTAVLAAIESRLGRRGLRLVVADVSVGFNGVALDQPEVYIEGGKEPLFQAERLAVGFSWWNVSSGSRAITRIQIQQGGVMLDADSLQHLLTRRSNASEPASTKPELPRIELHDIDVTLRDASGALLQAEDLVLEVADGRFEGTGKKVILGSLPDDVATALSVQVDGSVRGRRPVLHHASAKSTLMVWADEPSGGTSQPATRRGIVQRLRAFVAAARPASIADKAAKAPAAASPAVELWTEDARISLPDLRVAVAAPNGPERNLLRDLRVELAAQGSAGFLAEGHGSSETGGKLAFKLHGTREPLSVEGDVKLEDLSLALFEPALPPLPYRDLSKARVSASLVLAARGLSGVGFRGELSLSDLTFASDGLARSPVGPITAKVTGEGSFTPLTRELLLERASVTVGRIEAGLSGTLAWPSGGYRVQIAAALPKSACADILAAVPNGVLDELAGIELSGDMSMGLDVNVAANDLDNTKVDFDVHDRCRFGPLPALLDLSRFTQPFTHTVLEPDGTLFEFETGPGTAAWTPIEQISPFMAQAAVAHEDGRFFSHHGFAEPEIAVALARNLKAKAFRFGASTITMQLVKNVFLRRDKLLARKVQEALITWWLEQAWDKRRILELYLNVIEYGPALYGIRNAAWHYFGTIPMNPTPAQSAFLASILPSPKTFHEYYDKGELTASMKNRLAVFLKHMRARDRIDDEALAFGLAELENFRFYRPEEPPPLPLEVHGSAAPLPFGNIPLPPPTIDVWDMELPPSTREDGSFGGP